MKKLYSLLLLSLTTVSFGQVFTDNFNYADISLLTDNGWALTGTSVVEPIDVGTSNGLLYTGYNTTAGNAARLDNNGQDLNKVFTTPVTTGTLYYSFLVNVASGDAGYFTHLGNGTNFVARVFVKPSANAGKINFGISNTGTASFAGVPTDFDINTTYLIIVKYDVSTTGAASIWVKAAGVPTTEATAGAPEHSTSASGQANIAAVYLRQYAATQNITLDEIKVYSTWFGTTPCALTLNAESVACDNITPAIDTYTATIPFTGGNTGTYNLATNFGTIGGDNPSTTATGNITISGITEGVNVTLTVTGTCGFTKLVAAPVCKPVNPLPFSESFPYTIGNSLNGEQKWTAVNTGDNILITTGNLTYTGITSSGNSITWVGIGAESRTLFTDTTTGTIYASFIATASDLANITTDLANTYFAVFTDATGASTNARVWIRKNGTQYQYGLGTGSTATDWDATLYNANDIQYVVLGYDFSDNTLKLFINPTVGGSAAPTIAVTPSAPYTSIGGFLFRQDTNTTTPTMIVDELRVTLTPNFTLGLQSNTIAGLNVYPNPVSNGKLYITSDSGADKTVAIYDVLGKQVMATALTNDVVNVSALNAGVYIVKVTEAGNTATRKLVIR